MDLRILKIWMALAKRLNMTNQTHSKIWFKIVQNDLPNYMCAYLFIKIKTNPKLQASLLSFSPFI